MCGICGQFTVQPAPVDVAMWNDIVDSMQRRGPDDRGLVYDAHCVFGARRLIILDRSFAGHLPMTVDGGAFWLNFNGELYNFRKLRRELESSEYRFFSTGDSEVVLRALQHWGLAALDRFNGMFALAFYDRRARTLTLARDHVGIKPLYVLEDERGLAFASQFDQLMRHPWARGRRPDPEAVAMYLRLGHIPAPRAYLKGTGMIEPGGWLRIDGDGRRDGGRYFRFGGGRSPSDEAATRRGSDAPVEREIDAVVSQAVVRQSVSDVPIGCYLSGGIDSPLIAACLAGASRGRLPTFSVAVASPELDESADAARYAAALRTEHHLEVLGEARVLDLLEDVVAATCEPLADEGIFPSLLVARLARRHVKVALSGEGGDELFWGYFQRQSPLLSPRPATASAEEPTGVRYLSFFAEFERRSFEEIFPRLPWWPEAEPGYGFDVTEPEALGHALRECEVNAYLPFILLKTDRASMHHGLEVRVPLLDREVIAAAQKLSAGDCLDLARGLGKLPLRRALHRRVGGTTIAKRGFTVPMDQWLRESLRGPLGESLRSLRGLDCIEVDRTALTRLERAHQRREGNHGMALWRLLCLDLWVRKLASMPKDS